VLDATVAALEVVDTCVGRIVDRVRELGGITLITADHGNAEQMLDDGKPHTAHTSNPVPLVVTDPDVSLRPDGELSDLVPTAISLLGLAKPLQMTGHNVIEKSE
jgi:2,3-bisphosphoglycerate-independent phosphoglycerate mutase